MRGVVGVAWGRIPLLLESSEGGLEIQAVTENAEVVVCKLDLIDKERLWQKRDHVIVS